MSELRKFRSGSPEAGVRVLVVEDNAADIFWLEMVFKSARIAYTIDLALDGEAAQRHLRTVGTGSESPQIIFLDMHLPGCTAHDILDSLPNEFEVPIFILSGSELPFAIREQVGVERCLIKPLTHEVLVSCLRSIGLLEGYRRSAALRPAIVAARAILGVKNCRCPHKCQLPDVMKLRHPADEATGIRCWRCSPTLCGDAV